MTAEQRAQWQRVEDYCLDADGASFPFSAKLAQENGWTLEFASRAVHEYKRFVFLSTVCGHPVSPSEVVDQAWHMHLIYTQDYWGQFCPKILGKPLHHSPSSGGRDESAKFEDWYAKTLASYESVYGVKPPVDIWPRVNSHGRYVRIDRDRHWIIRKPSWRTGLKSLALISLVPVLAGCSQSGTLNPLDFTGPEFLGFYFFLQLAFFGLAGLGRSALRTPTSGEPVHTLNAYDIAYLNGGEVLTVNTAVTGLVGKGLTTVDAKSGTLQSTQPDDQVDGLQRAILLRSGYSSPTKMSDIRIAAAPYVAHLRAKLEDRGLVLTQSRATQIAFVSVLIALAPNLLGAAKISVGVSRDKPVAFLIAMMALSVLTSLLVFCRRPTRSRYGDKVLSDMRQETTSDSIYRSSSGITSADTLMMGVALYGLGSLAPTPYRDLKQGLQPPSGSSGCGGSTSSGCGGDGGGGCGGGGCGGCGGGGD